MDEKNQVKRMFLITSTAGLFVFALVVITEIVKISMT